MQQVNRAKVAMKESTIVDYVKQVFDYGRLANKKSTHLPLVDLQMINFYGLKTAVDGRGGYEAVSKKRNHAK